MEDRPTLVVGIDGTPISQYALEWAVRHAATIDGEVVAVAVCPVTPIAHGAMPVPVIDSVPSEHELKVRRVLLDTAIEAAGLLGTDVPIRGVVATGLPGPTLCAAVDIEKAVLLAVGSHSRGPVLRTLLGSVSAYCVQHASCPVIVMPAMLDAAKSTVPQKAAEPATT